MSELRKKIAESNKAIRNQNMNAKPSGGSFDTYFVLPEGLNLWIPKHSAKGIEYYVDLVPFPYGPNFPNEPWQTPWKEGYFPYTLLIEIHKNVGPENIWVICNKLSYGEKCPICEDLKARQKDEPDKEKRTKIWMELRNWRRQFYYVIVNGKMEDGKYHEEDPELRVWELPAPYMQDKLDVIRYQGRSGETIDYWDVDFGKTIKFTYKTKGEYGEFMGHGFEDRIIPKTKEKYVIDDEFIDQAESFPLDRALKRMTYDEVSKLYHAGKSKVKTEEDGPEEETPPPSRRRGSSIATEPEKPKDGECPSGGIWGKDCLGLEACNDCADEVYRKCEEEKERLDAENPPARRRRR